MLLVIDNYDSFTFNLVQYFRMFVSDVKVVRNNAVSLQEIFDWKPSHIVISPGPGKPSDAGITLEVIEAFFQTVPILGVCLGHQAIGQYFGAEVVKAKRVMHGKTSEIQHVQKSLFENIPNPFIATRYHSLVLDRESMPSYLDVTAWTLADRETEEIMGIQHKHFPVFGVQFHPESILTIWGQTLIKNFYTQNLL